MRSKTVILEENKEKFSDEEACKIEELESTQHPIKTFFRKGTLTLKNIK